MILPAGDGLKRRSSNPGRGSIAGVGLGRVVPGRATPGRVDPGRATLLMLGANPSGFEHLGVKIGPDGAGIRERYGPD